MNCLSCSTPMTTDRCACGGAWLGEAKLVEMAQDMRGTLVTLPWSDRANGEHRKCPTCAKEMRTVSLVDVELDQCEAHGIWFDAHELQSVLSRAEQMPAPAQPRPKRYAEGPRVVQNDRSTPFQLITGLLDIFSLF